MVSDRQVMGTDSTRELDLRTLGGNEPVTVAVHAPLFHARAGATLGPAFLEASPSDRFSLSVPGHRSNLNRRLLAPPR